MDLINVIPTQNVLPRRRALRGVLRRTLDELPRRRAQGGAVAHDGVLRVVRHTRRRRPKARGRRMRKARGREKIRVALEQQIWNEIESSHFAFPLHTQPGCYITVPSCSARVTLKEHTPRAISHVRLALGNVHCDVPLTKIMFALCSNIMFISCLYCPKVYILLRECASQCQTNVYLTRRLSSLY